MSNYPAYPAYPAGAPSLVTEPVPAEVAVAEAARQRRLTVAFRLILIIPHLFLLFFLEIAAVVVAFLGWWGALFTGRLPQFAVTYLAGFATWYLRVMAYMLLLTDVYPPFTLDDVPAYPVRLAVPERQRLNRFAVFFRFILLIPGAIVAGVAFEGATNIVAFIAWLITLITGRLPRPLHQAFTAVIRYQMRLTCYEFMLTPAYPWGLFGDAPGAPSGNAPGYGAGPEYGSPPGYGAPGYGTPGSVYGAPGGYGAQGGYAAPGGYGPGQTVFQPASWQLVLGPAAKRLLVLFLVLGAIAYVVSGIYDRATFSRASNIATANNAIDELNSSYNTLSGKMTQWQSAVSACDQNLTCVTRQDANAASYFTTFATELQATSEPPGATAAANRVYAQATHLAQEYTQLSQAANVSDYQATYNRVGLQQSLNAFDSDVNALGTTLNNS